MTGYIECPRAMDKYDIIYTGIKVRREHETNEEQRAKAKAKRARKSQ